MLTTTLLEQNINSKNCKKNHRSKSYKALQTKTKVQSNKVKETVNAKPRNYTHARMRIEAMASTKNAARVRTRRSASSPSVTNARTTNGDPSQRISQWLISRRARCFAVCLIGLTTLVHFADGYTNLLPTTRSGTSSSGNSNSASVYGQQLYSSDVSGSSSSGNSNSNKPPDEFELHVGRALDILRSDYPKMLDQNPNFSIYDPKITCIDPSGVQTKGLGQYKAAFNLLHALVPVFYCTSRSTIQSRMCYDTARRMIRIHWNVELKPREIFGGSKKKNAHFVDGISIYELSRASGNITQHRIDHLLFNNHPVLPKEGLIAALRKKQTGVVPSFFQPSQQQPQKKHSSPDDGHHVAQFVPSNRLFRPQHQSLFEGSSSGDAAAYPDLDWDALESKNKSRQKFGLKPLTPEEFLAIEADIEHLVASQQQQQQSNNAHAAATNEAPKPSSMLNKLFGTLRVDTCESNYDCARPEVCCDFGFVKKCCSNGSPVLGTRKGDLAYLRVPQGNPELPQQPPYPPTGNY